MEKLHADKISEWVQGKLDGDAKACADKAATDTRTMEAGSLYFAIRGERFDGHQFIEKAFEKGVHRSFEISYSPPPGCAVIIVKDRLRHWVIWRGDISKHFLYPSWGLQEHRKNIHKGYDCTASVYPVCCT